MGPNWHSANGTVMRIVRNGSSMERSAAGTLTAADIRAMERLVAEFGGMEEAWRYIRRYQRRAEELLAFLPPCDAAPLLRKLVSKLGAV